MCIFTPFFINMQVASFLVYLTDVSEGGETNFPYEVKVQLIITSQFTKYFT